MKRMHARLGRLAAVAGMALYAGFTSATPITYSIHQPGWALGGEVNGMFEGEDLNHDGHIELAAGEVSRYEISFVGGWFIPAFTHTLNDLLYFDYTLGSGGFRPSFPLYSLGAGYFYDADDHAIGSLTGGMFGLTGYNWTVSDATVLPVPAPATLPLVLPGLLFLAFGSLKRSARMRFRQGASNPG